MAFSTTQAPEKKGNLVLPHAPRDGESEPLAGPPQDEELDAWRKKEHTLFKFTRRTKIQFYSMKDNENYKVIIIPL